MSQKKLTVLITLNSNADMSIRCLQSLLLQADPIGTDYVVWHDESQRDLIQKINQLYPRILASKLIRYQEFKERRNSLEAIETEFIAFMDAREQWAYGRLIELWPMLDQADLFCALSKQTIKLTPEFFDAHYVRSSLVIRRANLRAALPFVPSSMLDFNSDGGEFEKTLALSAWTELMRQEAYYRFTLVSKLNILAH